MAGLVAKRYAAALFDLAYQELKINAYEQEVKELIAVLKAEPDFIAFLGSEKVSETDKMSAIENVFNGKVSSVLTGLMKLLTAKNRQDFLIEILETFLEVSKRKSNIVKATVISAVELSSDQLEQIKNNLESGTRKPIELSAEIDASIIGGLIIKVGDQAVDASLRGKMQDLKKQLMRVNLGLQRGVMN